MIDAGCFPVFPRMPFSKANMLSGRRRSKNSGGGIAPAAIASLIEGALCSVNAFRGPRRRRTRLRSTDKVLKRLNFFGAPVIA
jgi:hypothetical protein